MLVSLLTTNTPQEIASALTGQAPLRSDGGAGIIGAVIGFAIGILAVTINYRRNHSILYAILAFFFSEFYLAYVVVGLILKKVGM
jgi:hypothetical protein